MATRIVDEERGQVLVFPDDDEGTGYYVEDLSETKPVKSNDTKPAKSNDAEAAIAMAILMPVVGTLFVLLYLVLESM